MARAASRVARLLRVALEPAGVNLVHATGVAAWQSVFHFHTHVVPRYRADELQVMWRAVAFPTPSWPPCGLGCLGWAGSRDRPRTAPDPHRWEPR